ncbi:hypothetical protein [Halalkalibacter urbisdiaboli]|uniref:hypothetical protein n=1 Tax=Halalkalibacter urbisdiaboli TaxID=1960589 RepID=UPI000B44A1BC|nr:hypothetical protein [Halalkalibacter urbisdiaboli]
MTLKEDELKAALEKFDFLIVELPDKKPFIPEFIHFISSFLRTRTTTVHLPIEDVMAVLKQKKPFIFSEIKSEYKHNILFTIVTDINIEYYTAYKRLNELKRLLGVTKRY